MAKKNWWGASSACFRNLASLVSVNGNFAKIKIKMHQTEFRLVRNHREKCNCNPDLVCFNIELRKLYLHFLSNLMGYNLGGSFPFDFEPYGIPFGSENRKEKCHHDHIPFTVKGNGIIVFSV